MAFAELFVSELRFIGLVFILYIKLTYFIMFIVIFNKYLIFFSIDQYMAQLRCESNDDCSAGIRMICEHKKCTCRHGELFIDYLKFGCFVKGLCYYSF